MSYTPKNANGQAIKANSAPVVLASDQDALAITASSLPLPTGSATSAKQDTGNASLASIDGKITAVNTGAVTVVSSALPTGAATSANQSTTNSSLSTIATNTGNGATSANQTSGNQKTKITDGTTDLSIQNLGSGQNAITTAPGMKEIASLTAGSLNADLIPSTDISSFQEVSLQVLGTWVGTFTIQGSNDNSNFVSVLYESSTNGSATQVPTFNANGIYRILRKYRWLRVRMTAYTSGTATGTAELYTQVSGPSSGTTATQGGTWTFGANSATGSAIPANALPVGGTDGTNLRGLSVSTTGVLYVQQRADTSTLGNIAAATSSTTLIASNTGRKGATIYNDSSSICYVKFGSTASSTSFTVPLAANTYYEVPGGYTGIITGIWVSATGNARVTELT